MNRESFGSRLGFILVSAGCAIGIGNVWKFPYLAGQHGGGIFVLFYLLFLAVLGLPVLTMELAVGRASRKSAVGGYRALEPKGSFWHVHGWFAVAGCALLMMYYTTVSGWMLDYFYKFATGAFSAVTAETSDTVFQGMLADPAEMILFMAITVVVGFAVCSGGLRKGLEKVTKVMMLCLLFLILVLAIHSLTLSGAKEGLAFYLMPSLARVREVGLRTVIVQAMNQAFFTLSLGVGAMEIFGSYMSEKHTLVGESVRIVALDTFVALMAGLIIFPACFSFNVEPGQGPALIFLTLPKIFLTMPGGRIWGSLFFLFMTFAALSTELAVFENILAAIREMTGWNRRKGCVVCGIGIFLVALTTALGYSVFTFQPFAEGTAWLDFWDFIVSTNLLPLGALVFTLYCCYDRYGWGWDNFIAEANAGKGLKVQNWMKPVFKYLVPVAIIVIYIIGLVNFPWR